MTDCHGQYENVCKGEFGELHAKLDRLDEAIRGNGRPGLRLRLDRLEAAEKSRNRIMWIVLGAAVTWAVRSIWQIAFG